MVLHRSGMVFLERSDSKILITHRSPKKGFSLTSMTPRLPST